MASVATPVLEIARETESSGVNFWDRRSGWSPPHILGAALRTLHDQHRSGTLCLRGPGRTELEFHLQEGRVISCASEADDWELARLVVSAGVIGVDALGSLVDSLEITWLPDLLVAARLMTERDVIALVSEVVRDNVMYACTTGWRDIWFIGGGTTFPTRMQLHLDTRRLLLEVERWHAWVRPLVDLLADQPAQMVRINPDRPVAQVEHRMVAGLASRAIPIGLLFARSPIARFRTMSALVHLVAQGAINIWPCEEGPTR
jgi:hypothetical protein